jgi:hypothetical protein
VVSRASARKASFWAYAGPYRVVGDGLIIHHVDVSLLPNWIGGTEYRPRTCRAPCSSSAHPSRT